MNHYKKAVEGLFGYADIAIDGKRPWDIQVHNEEFYRRFLKDGSLGLGESYMDGWWDCNRLDEFFYHIFRADLESKVKEDWRTYLRLLMVTVFNLQTRGRASQNVKRHYDLGNDLFVGMLGKSMVYSCGYWKNAKNLEEAQEAKLDLVCKKIGLKPGMEVLDIGCGWGGFARYAAEKHGANVVCVTISKEQAKYVEESCKGLPIEIRLQDYRDVEGQFDAIVSLAMFEHVGYKNYRAYIEFAHRCLKDDGIFLLHTIGSNYSKKDAEPWANRYIFPNGVNPSLQQITSSVERLFMIEDLHNFGPDYEKTAMAWYKNFQKSWPHLRNKYDDRFKRMWDYFLLAAVGCFKARDLHVWQFVMTKTGREQPNCRFG